MECLDTTIKAKDAEIAALRAEVEALKAERSRMNDQDSKALYVACERAGIQFFGFDSPEHLADIVIEQKARAEAAEAKVAALEKCGDVLAQSCEYSEIERNYVAKWRALREAALSEDGKGDK